MDIRQTESADRGEEDRIRAAYARRDDARHPWFHPGQLFMVQERERRLLTLLSRLGFMPLHNKTLLEVGCGTGAWLRDFIRWGGRPENLTGIELLPDRLAAARQLCPDSVHLLCGSAAQLHFPDASFDVVFQSMVFTSILDSRMKERVAAEMLRVLKPDGRILWYDFRVDNPWNPDVRGVKKREIEHLFPGCRIDMRPITLAPPLARALAPYSWLACHLLETIPFLCTHYLGTIRKGNANGGVPPLSRPGHR